MGDIKNPGILLDFEQTSINNIYTSNRKLKK